MATTVSADSADSADPDLDGLPNLATLGYLATPATAASRRFARRTFTRPSAGMRGASRPANGLADDAPATWETRTIRPVILPIPSPLAQPGGDGLAGGAEGNGAPAQSLFPGFQAKCPAWLVLAGLAEAAERERWREGSETDHAKVSQFFLQQAMTVSGTGLWGVAVGAHHGKIQGRRIPPIYEIPQRVEWEQAAREQLLAELVAIFGSLPTHAPLNDNSDLWCLAGLISVADWIGSNENFFPCNQGLTLGESRKAATRALDQIHWQGGAFRPRAFGELFRGYAPLPLQ
ncbi:MAG: hypothetical protein RLZZ522_1994, partial [Verrucomicrobiota bacterium]